MSTNKLDRDVLIVARHKKNMSIEFGNGNLIKLTEEEELVLVKNLFYTSSAYLGKFCRVVEIHRHKELKNPREVCLEALFILSNNMQGKCINLCVTYTWHGTSKAVLSQILDNGSNSKGKNIDDGSCRVLYLTQDPEHRAVDSIVSSTPDETGLIYVLFCCVIGQDVSEKFIAWNPYIDKHVQLLYVLTIRLAYKVERTKDQLGATVRADDGNCWETVAKSGSCHCQ